MSAADWLRTFRARGSPAELDPKRTSSHYVEPPAEPAALYFAHRTARSNRHSVSFQRLPAAPYHPSR
jgi:hypothetical protein